MRQLRDLNFLALLAIVAAVFLLTAGCESCGTAEGGPSEDLQNRWANAACEPHQGVEDLDLYYNDESPATATCRDGSIFTQRHNEGSAYEWERPVEVRARR